MDALAAYRDAFRPSPQFAAPYVMLGVSVVVAESEERARWLAGPGALAIVRMRSGRPDVYPTPEEAAGYQFTPAERNIVADWTKTHIVGTPATVREQLEQLVDRTGVDELIVTTMVHGHQDRLESYRLLADAFGLEQPAIASGATRAG
jgi:alkanesulfonate monooxygenase SsuD/methylene tetrahydromethanopterin reductase-like flavin-dependent oxidoreductase (luciferase family)